MFEKFDKNKATLKPEEKISLLDTIKSLQNVIEQTRKELKTSALPAKPVAATTPAAAATTQTAAAAAAAVGAAVATAGATATPATPVKTRQELDKEILDTELELYSIQADGENRGDTQESNYYQSRSYSNNNNHYQVSLLSGGDINALKAQLQQLKAQKTTGAGRGTAAAHRVAPYPAPRGRGGWRGRGRGRGRGFAGAGGFAGSGGFATVDRRSTKINASGFEREDKADVLAHFAVSIDVTRRGNCLLASLSLYVNKCASSVVVGRLHNAVLLLQVFGTVTSYEWDGATPAVEVTYATRREAEKAMVEGRTLADRLLTLTWVSSGGSPLGE